MILQNRRDQALRKAGDDDSEMSAESATSDSGRGGSEEDINSNRGNPMSDTGMRNTFLLVQTYTEHIDILPVHCITRCFDKQRHMDKKNGNGE